MSRFQNTGLILACLAASMAAPHAGEPFPLVAAGRSAELLTDPADAKVVAIAASCLASDIAAVTGKTPTVVNKPSGKPAVIIGTLGKSRAIDSLAANGKIDARRIRGKWESFLITPVDSPFPGIPSALVIAGSDPRATAYGVFALSESIGVSPWIWWADAAPARRDELIITTPARTEGPPSVKYRGIFLNDEDWGLQPWAATTFEPDAATIGPKTHARIFELMLRLRANTLWPAMHKCTTPFHAVPGNNAVADDYAIVLGSSHAEPMLRNNVGEWTAPKGNYNYLSHRDDVLSYWEDRVKQRASGESLFTIGMRGIHDSPIIGPQNQRERIKTLQSVFDDQRALLARHFKNGASQIFCPYKEVLADYHAGLSVPDDVTLVWPDDNFGYVRHFPTARERSRPGGSGVYYHLSYLGNPLSWLWFDSLPPALVWEEMHKAWEQGARDFWIANVGDIKGNELSTEAFLNLAWNAERSGPDWALDFLEQFAARNFGTKNAAAIAGLWARHQALAFARKPEHLQWHLSLTPYQPCAMTFGEITARLRAYDTLAGDAAKTTQSLPSEKQAAAFQLITYPVACARAANQRYFQLELARRGFDKTAVQIARSADAEIAALTRQYNEEISRGKWRGIMTAGGVSPRDWIRFQPTPFSKQLAAITPDKRPPPPPDKPAEPNPPADAKPGDFIERDGAISMHAGHFTTRADVPGGGWRVVPGLGRTGSAVTVLPTTLSGAPSLSYRFFVSNGGPATLHIRLLPTHPVANGGELRLAWTIDSGSLRTVAAKHHKPKSPEWKLQVMANALSTESEIPSGLSPGWHTLRIGSVDPGIVLDKIVIDLGGLLPSYDGPPETRIPN